MVKRTAFWLLLLALLFLVVEVASRAYLSSRGYTLGNYIPYWETFEQTDSLVVKNHFFTDSLGIYRTNDGLWKENESVRINKAGFRGREYTFSSQDSAKLKVLHIGDSFTWGASASSYENCFVRQAEKLMPNSIHLNAGVSGTDPAQYALLVKHLSSSLKPDVIVVHLYLANDLMAIPRPTLPNQMLYYQTNIGWLPGYWDGQVFGTAQASYNYFARRYIPESGLEKFAANTGIGNIILSAPLRWKEYQFWQACLEGEVTNSYLKEIQEVCKVRNIRFELFVIPNSYADFKGKSSSIEDYVLSEYQPVFEGIDNVHVYPAQLNDYEPAPDAHFNDAGHLMAGQTIAKVLGN